MRLHQRTLAGACGIWPAFRKLGLKSQPEQSAKLRGIFPNGTCLVVTFAASEEIFPETRQNFLALITAHPELESRLTKEFWFAGKKIYELYEVTRSSRVN